METDVIGVRKKKRKTLKSADLEEIITETAKANGFSAVKYTPYDLYNGYSLYDSDNVNYELRSGKHDKVVETYPLSARIVTGRVGKGTVYNVNRGSVLVYCTNEYYEDIFGQYYRISKFLEELADATGATFLVREPDRETEWTDEAYDPVEDRIRMSIRDPDGL